MYLTVVWGSATVIELSTALLCLQNLQCPIKLSASYSEKVSVAQTLQHTHYIPSQLSFQLFKYKSKASPSHISFIFLKAPILCFTWVNLSNLKQASTWHIQSTSARLSLLSVLRKTHPLVACVLMSHSTQMWHFQHSERSSERWGNISLSFFKWKCTNKLLGY